ncbi:hypothetical protein Efla_003557 [Eimeria flavescens]
MAPCASCKGHGGCHSPSQATLEGGSLAAAQRRPLSPSQPFEEEGAVPSKDGGRFCCDTQMSAGRRPFHSGVESERTVPAAVSETLFAAPKQLACRPSFHARRIIEAVFISLVLAICCLPDVSCIRQHNPGNQAGLGPAAEADVASSTDIQQRLAAALEAQLAQLETQEKLEALAMPFVASSRLSPPSAVMRNPAEEAQDDGQPGDLDALSLVDMGSLLSTSADGNPASVSLADLQAAEGPSPSAAFSFINWGQVGGALQSPALAHTGMGVPVPRQVVGTTVGLDFDSPATFHGPLLVALMRTVCGSPGSHTRYPSVSR